MFSRRLSLIAYIRAQNTEVSRDKQILEIKEYCREHGYRFICYFEDKEEPSIGLRRALESLSHADGLIVYDSSRVVLHREDAVRELRPLLARIFMHGHKKFIAVADGIENVTTVGQENLIELMNKWSERENLHAEKMDFAFGQNSDSLNAQPTG